MSFPPFPAVVSPLLVVLTEKMSPANLEELRLPSSVMNDVEELHSTLSAVKPIVNDMEGRIPSPSVVSWLRAVRVAAYDADDAIDDLQSRCKPMTSTLAARGVKVRRDLFPSLDLDHYKMSTKIKHSLTTFDRLLNDGYLKRLPRDRYKTEYRVYGRDSDREKVVDLLISHQYNDTKLSAVVISGPRGIGKTALARLIYHDEMIEDHFDVLMWVWVGRHFDADRLVREATASALLDEYLDSELSVRTNLRKILHDNRFLLVLDEYWHVDSQAFESLVSVFGGCMSGSKILVTTRAIEDADTIMGSMKTTAVLLSPLSDSDSWELFKEEAFRWKDLKETPELVEVGIELAKKSCGLPLLAVALGNFMASKKLREAPTGSLYSLWSSYSNLTPRLRQIVNYFLLLRQDHSIDWFKLNQLWMAEEFIHSLDNNMDEELSSILHYRRDDLGNVGSYWMPNYGYLSFVAAAEYITELDKGLYIGDRRASVILDDGWRETISIVSLNAPKLRSLLVFRQKQYLTPDIEESVPNEITKLAYLRVLYLRNTGIKRIPSTIGKLKHLRFLDLSRNSISNPDLIAILGNLKQIRFLDLSENMIATLPNSVTTLYNLESVNLSRNSISNPDSIASLGNLKQLRFLDLSENMITTLPDSVTNLYKLETLNLKCCKLLQVLPEGLTSMSKLEILDISGCDRLAYMPYGLSRLCSLHKLTLFVVSDELGRTIVELKDLNEIRGRLRIEDLQNVQDKMEAIDAKLGAKAGLQCLEFCWNRKGETPPPSREVDKEILEGLRPHPSLRSLGIENYNLDRFPDWLMKMDTLSNLEELSLHNLRSSVSLPPVSQLPNLKRLYICRLDAVEQLGADFFGNAGTFTRLQRLVLCNLPNLTEWIVPADSEMFPCLESMEISWCPKMTVLTCLPPSIKELTMLSSNEELLGAGAGAGGGLPGLSRLRKLIVTGFGASKSRWEGLQCLTALQELTISCCPKLTCLPKGVLQQQFPSLHTLELELNTNLSSLGDGGEAPPALATSLQHLIVRECAALKALPKWVTHQMLQQPRNAA